MATFFNPVTKLKTVLKKSCIYNQTKYVIIWGVYNSYGQERGVELLAHFTLRDGVSKHSNYQRC